MYGYFSLFRSKIRPVPWFRFFLFLFFFLLFRPKEISAAVGWSNQNPLLSATGKCLTISLISVEIPKKTLLQEENLLSESMDKEGGILVEKQFAVIIVVLC